MENQQGFEERFHQKYEKKESGCWEWTGAITGQGYGNIYNKTKDGEYKYYNAHKASWLIHNGQIEDGKQVLHKCHNKSCVNPNHLYLGDHKQNAIDAVENDDWNTPNLEGENNPNAKLSEDDVKLIRRAYNQGEKTTKELAETYPVSRSYIYMILNEECWS
jgi:hypothetical protein